MRASFIFVLIMIFLLPSAGFALPVESVPAPGVHSGDSIAAGIAPGPPMAKIPKFPVEMFIRRGTSSRFELFFLNVKYGYDLVDFEFYNAWCLRKGAPLPGNIIHTVRLYNSYDPNLPPEFKSMAWHQINYLINHKKGSKEAIQQAIWRLAGSSRPRKLSVEALRLVKEANLKGKDYEPAEGDLIAIICQSAIHEQPVFIEYKIPQRVPAVVASASFTPPAPLPPLPPTSYSVPFWLPLIPYIPTGGGGGPPPPPPPPPVPEPSTLLLLACGMAGILISRKFGRPMKRRQFRGGN